MALVYNATDEIQSVKAAGNWFTFKPKQMKMLHDNIATFISMERLDYGLIVLPVEFEDPEYMQTQEGKDKLAAFTVQGINNLCASLRRRIYNLQSSLRQDLEKANIKVDPAIFATDADLEAMRLLAKYQAKEDDGAQKKVDEVRKLMEKVKEVH